MIMIGRHGFAMSYRSSVAEKEKLSEGTSVLAQDGMPAMQVIFACEGTFRNDARRWYGMMQRLN